LGDFLLIWLLLNANDYFSKDEVTQRKWLHFWLLFTWPIFYIFTQVVNFKAGFVAGIFTFQKLFYVDVLDFQIEF
jgi:hypothetical protein